LLQRTAAASIKKIADGNNLCLVVRNGRGFCLECRDEQKPAAKV
jgi:hypothetical protein